MPVTIITPPVSEPVSLSELKAQVRVSTTTEDALITSLGVAARAWIEEITGTQIVEATLQEDFDVFPSAVTGDPLEPILLGRAPVQSVISVAYVDADGVSQTWVASEYQADVASIPARIRPAYGASYPATRAGKMNAVSVTYVAGDNIVDAPDKMKAAIKLIVAHWYDHRQAVGTMQLHEAPMAVKSLIWPSRLWTIPR